MLKKITLFAWLIALPGFCLANMNGVDFGEILAFLILLFGYGPLLLVSLFSVKARNRTYLMTLAVLHGASALILSSYLSTLFSPLEFPFFNICNVIMVVAAVYFFYRRARYTPSVPMDQERDS